MSRPKQDYTVYEGQKFGRWAVLKFLHHEPNLTTMLCQCVFGRKKEVTLNNLKSGRSTGCRECHGSYVVGSKHNLSHNPLYRLWHSIMAACYSTSNHDYGGYGGRGVRVCLRWHQFENFQKDIKFEKGKAFALLDHTKDYALNNCRWMTRREMGKTRLEHSLLTSVELARRTGYSRERIRQMSGHSSVKEKVYILVPFIESEHKIKSSIRVIFKESAVAFLSARRKGNEKES